MTTASKTSTIFYWITTGLIALLMIGSATLYIVKHDMVVENMKHLGYPSYLATILPFTKTVISSVTFDSPFNLYVYSKVIPQIPVLSS